MQSRVGVAVGCARLTRGTRPGELYVLKGCCTLCGIPWEYARELFGYDDNGCWVSRQPATPTERAKMLKVIACQELDCIHPR